jgi:hypothetical protein
MRKLLAFVLLIGAPTARPDTCAVPSTTGYVSDDGTTVVRIEFGRPKEFYPDPKDCAARIARWHEEDRSYRFVRTVVLRNPVGPGEAVISNDARYLVTFDDFCEAGMTENAVVIYDLEKGTVVSCGIEDFLPKAYRETLHRSISNINWGGHPYLNDEDRKIWIPPPRDSIADFSVVIDLATNSITLSPPQPQ